MPSIYIDVNKCQPLIVAWSSYHREWVEQAGIYYDTPAHDKSCHYADAGRYLTMALKKISSGGMTAEESRAIWQQHIGR